MAAVGINNALDVVKIPRHQTMQASVNQHSQLEIDAFRRPLPVKVSQHRFDVLIPRRSISFRVHDHRCTYAHALSLTDSPKQNTSGSSQPVETQKICKPNLKPTIIIHLYNWSYPEIISRHKALTWCNFSASSCARLAFISLRKRLWSSSCSLSASFRFSYYTTQVNTMHIVIRVQTSEIHRTK